MLAILSLIDIITALFGLAEVAPEVGKDKRGKRSWKLAVLHLTAFAGLLVLAGVFAYATQYHWSFVTHSLIWALYALGVFTAAMLLWIGVTVLRNRGNRPKTAQQASVADQ